MNTQTQIDNDIKFIESYFSGSKALLWNDTNESLSYELYTDFCYSKSNEKDFNDYGLESISICPNNAGLKILFKRDLSPKPYTIKSKSQFILITGNIPRLAFDTQEQADNYLENHNNYDNTKIIKVYSGIEFIEVKN